MTKRKTATQKRDDNWVFWLGLAAFGWLPTYGIVVFLGRLFVG